MKTYPVNLVLQDKLVVLIGAGREIARKVPALLEVGARIKVVAPAAHPTVQHYAAAGQIEWIPRCYQPGDLSGAALVIAATRDQAAHDAIWAEGQTNGQLVNVMDVIPQCNFHGVSVVRQGQLTVSIGTGGAAPALAVTLRKRFETEFGPEYAAFLDYAQTLRPVVAQRLPFAQRANFWYALLDQDVLTDIRHGAWDRFEEKVESLLAHYAQTTATA